MSVKVKHAKDVIARVHRVLHLQGKQMDIWSIVTETDFPSCIWLHVKRRFHSDKSVERQSHRCSIEGNTRKQPTQSPKISIFGSELPQPLNDAVGLVKYKAM